MDPLLIKLEMTKLGLLDEKRCGCGLVPLYKFYSDRKKGLASKCIDCRQLYNRYRTYEREQHG